MTDAPLLAKLRDLIEANGPMSVAEYMTHCLSDPVHGYYATRDPFGVAGDFITAPEISQMFGEIVGAWLVDVWQRLGGPDPVNLVELGPGRGTLMSDILRVARLAPDFEQAVSIHLVETSPVLKKRQQEVLNAAGAEAHWHDAFNQVPPGPLLVIANEFFDALPIRQFVRLDIWRERAVGLDVRGRLAFGVGPGVLDDGPDAPQGSIFEICPAATAIMTEIAMRVADENGAALIIDYGHAQSASGETLQALYGQSFSDPLDRPGESDLTAHVDFAALGRTAAEAGAATHGPMPQGEFLNALGLMERAEQLSATADAAERDTVRAAVERLSAAEEMGALFKALAVTPRGIVPPPFG